jgi:aldehyde dehydrogenase (NAD+)
MNTRRTTLAEQPREVVSRLREAFEAGTTLPQAARIAQLRALERLLGEQEGRLAAALAADLAKPAFEGRASDVWGARHEVVVQRKGLRHWGRPRRAPLPISLRPGRATIEHLPLGVVLVVAPWNYPINLTIVPLAAALAAGNCVVVKPSELAPATSALLAELLPRYLDGRIVACVEGGASATTALIDAGVDHLFFTGSAKVGRIVAARAAAQLTPVTLELGGKSPVYVDERADLALAARQILFGKFWNAGQSCVAPDYVLVHRGVAERFVAELVAMVPEFFGLDAKTSPDYGRLVDVAHLERLEALVATAGGRVVAGGEADAATRYFAPTILVDPEPSSALMREEIFGPVLPVLVVDDLDAALHAIKERPDPLCAYLFSADRQVRRRFAAATRSGSLSCNTTIEHFVAEGLPFGGLGASGSGRYHGRYGFETFSHLRPVLRRPTRGRLRIVSPPYGRVARSLIRRLL